MAGTESVNYLLRPGKNVARKLLFECFSALDKWHKLQSYTYVGLGSIWFVDFIFAHKILGIESLVSIEKSERTYKRAVFNAPYKCIAIQHSATTHYLPKLRLGNNFHLLWLDYTSGLNDGVVEDIDIVCGNGKAGTIYALAVDAEVEDLVDRASDLDISAETLLRNIAGDSVPTPLSAKATHPYHFPETLSQILISLMKDRTSTGSAGRKTFVPLVNYKYRDTKTMIIVGGAICDSDDTRSLQNTGVFNLSHVTGEEQFVVDVPELTPKEKRAIDQLLPNSGLDRDYVAQQLKIDIDESELQAYRSLYRYYPVYQEIIT